MKPHPPHFTDRRHTARSLALQVLLDCRRHDAFVQEILDRRLSASSLAGPDRRLATQLAYGVLRRRGTLLALLRPLISRQPQQVEPWLWDALCLGAYQLAMLRQIPVHAALHETVELAAAFGRPGAKGFLNGVLRALVPLITADIVAEPGPDALPLEGGEYRRLARPALPDPRTHPVEYLAEGFGLPRWLAERWLARYPAAECSRLGFWFAGPAPLTLRVNALRTDRPTLLAALRQAGLDAEPGEHPHAVRLREPASVPELPGYNAGWFTVQDESGMWAASALELSPGDSVLDLCAAPGGKTTYLAERMGDRGRIVACDVKEHRLQTIHQLARRLGLTCIETCLLHDKGAAPEGQFDAVLVDVPCSNTGVLGRRPEARWRLRPEDLRELGTLQTCLLRTALDRVRPGGAVVYSTCSIEPEENGAVVRSALRGAGDFLLEAEEEQTPGRPADGGYWARLRRGKGSTET
jgi:16S rRNA (cytosine967-C5)-methyltransferase